LVCKKRDMLTDKMTHCHSLQSHKTNQKYGNMKMSCLFMDGRKKKDVNFRWCEIQDL
jgi:hypothetical protein